MKEKEGTTRRAKKFNSEELLKNLAKAMEVDKLFCDVNLTIESLADMMGTNRTYLSKTINDNFQMPFRQWLNSYRIEQSIQYMLHHPAANQEEIDKHSGFLSASAFNHKFKAVTGTSPRLWLVEMSIGNKFKLEKED